MSVKSEPADWVPETAEFYCEEQSFSIIMIRAAEYITVCQKTRIVFGYMKRAVKLVYHKFVFVSVKWDSSEFFRFCDLKMNACNTALIASTVPE